MSAAGETGASGRSRHTGPTRRALGGDTMRDSTALIPAETLPYLCRVLQQDGLEGTVRGFRSILSLFRIGQASCDPKQFPTSRYIISYPS